MSIVNFRNGSTTSNVCLKIVGKDGATITLPSTVVNPTVHLEGNVLTMCLSVSTGISCDGAIDYAKFYNPSFIPSAQYTLSINDVDYLVTGALADIANIAGISDTGLITYMDSSGNVYFNNSSENYLRIRITPNNASATGTIQVIDGGANPTVMKDSSGVITFCLAPSSLLAPQNVIATAS